MALTPEDQQIASLAQASPDFSYDSRERVLAQTSYLDTLTLRRRNFLISLAGPAAYFAVRRRFCPARFLAASFLTFSALNYFNEARHDLITREINIRASEKINKMMDLA